MSDIADKAADSVGAVEGAGASFWSNPYRGGYVTPRPKKRPLCSCGGPSIFRSVPRASEGMEILVCARCGNSVGPMSSRQALSDAWRLGGCRQGKQV